MEIYLDNSATTKIRPEVLAEITDTYVNNYGNPSSLHRKGLQIEKQIQWARKEAAKIINAKEEEVYFTSGGTESNNIAILGHMTDVDCKGKNIVTTSIEHPSVHNVYKHFENKLDVRYAATDEKGKVRRESLEEMLDENTLLVSIILVNNELGTVQDLREIAEIVRNRSKRARIHVDAIQGYGKVKIDVKKTAVDTLSFSSHKIHGPKGVGGLYVRTGCKINSVFFGGNQEKGLRPGTENTPGIVGFGKACELLNKSFNEETSKLYALKHSYGTRLAQEIKDIKINSDLSDLSAPHILNVSFKNVRGEVLVHYLEDRGIYVSTGAACSSKAKKDTRVLDAIKLDREYAQGTIRISFGYFNTPDEMEYVIKNIKETVGAIRDIMK